MISQLIGGPEYLKTHPGSAYIYLTIAGAASVIGTFGNLFILCCFYLNKNLQKSQNVYIISLALADLVVASFADPLAIMGMVLGKQFFDIHPALCDVAATVCLTVCVTALLSIGGMSINRYFFICQGAFYRKHFTLRINILICLICWAAGFCFSLPGLIGWTNNIYDHKMLQCMWNRTHNIPYTVFFSLVIVFLPTCLIGASFIKIYIHVRASRKRIEVAALQPTANKSSYRLARTLFIIFAIFISCWTPYAALVLVDWHDQAPPELHLYVLLLAHMHSTLSPVVYFSTNIHFRKVLLTGMSKMACFKPSCTPCEARNRSGSYHKISEQRNTVTVEQNSNGRLSEQERNTLIMEQNTNGRI